MVNGMIELNNGVILTFDVLYSPCQHSPDVFDRIEILRYCWPIKNINMTIVKPFHGQASVMHAGVILLNNESNLVFK